jgi:hypothetical protein
VDVALPRSNACSPQCPAIGVEPSPSDVRDDIERLVAFFRILTEWEAARAPRSDARAKPVAETTEHDERQS